MPRKYIITWMKILKIVRFNPPKSDTLTEHPHLKMLENWIKSIVIKYLMIIFTLKLMIYKTGQRIKFVTLPFERRF